MRKGFLILQSPLQVQRFSHNLRFSCNGFLFFYITEKKLISFLISDLISDPSFFIKSLNRHMQFSAKIK